MMFGKTPVTGTGFCVGEWTVWPKRCVIECRDQCVHIKPKSMAVLECLAGAAGEVVSREQIFNCVWPGAIVTDDVLTHSVVELRKAFGDSARNAQIIETIPKKGFRLIPEVLPESGKSEQDVQPSEINGGGNIKKPIFVVVALLVLALGLFAFESLNLDFEADAADITPTAQIALKPAVDRLSIAVLPFDNRSDEEGAQFFTDGIHDELLATIARIGSMKVISRTSVMGYRDTLKKLPQIAKELGVANILEGGVQRSGNQVRINVQLIDAATDEHLWAQIYDRELTAENLFAVQSEITKTIASALQARLSAEDRQRIDTMPTDNLQAYEVYMRGRQLMTSRDSAKLKLATEAFARAVELDPLFALAWVGVADSNMLLAGYNSAYHAEDLRPIWEEAVKNALAIDSGLGEAYVSQAAVHAHYQHLEEAEASYRKAIELSPNYATAYIRYSGFLGRYPLRIREQLDLTRKAAELDPRSAVIRTSLGHKYKGKGLYTLAVAQFQKVIELSPDFAPGYSDLAWLYSFEMSQFDKAVPLHRKAIEIDPGNYGYSFLLAFTYIQLGDLEAVQGIRKKMVNLGAKKWRLGIIDVLISSFKDNTAGTREVINELLPEIQHSPFWVRFLSFIALIQVDAQLSRDLSLSVEPGWLEPDQWPQLIERTRNYGCIVAWVLMNTGDQELGAALLEQSTAYIEENLPLVTEHPDRYFPDTCYLAAGDIEKALRSIETQLAHNHLYAWNAEHRMPIFDLIRDEPRYQAAWAERERRIAVQRAALAKSESGSGQAIFERMKQ